MHYTPEENLECAISLLQDDAYQWWVSVTRTTPLKSITWEFFILEFRKQYVGHIYLSNMRREFHNLNQTQMSVIEYQREFTQLSKYAPKMLVTEEEKCRKFEDGLNDYIWAYVTAFSHNDFSKIVTCALNVERVKKEEYDRTKRRRGKKNPGQSSSYHHKNKKFRGPQGSNQPTSQGRAQTIGSKATIPTPSIASAPGGSSRGPTPHCTHCGRKHKGECWRLIGACLVCRSNEHKVKDCPRARSFTAPQIEGTVSSVQKSNKDNKSIASPSAPRQATQIKGRQDSCAPARAYAIKAVEDKDAPDVIVGNFHIFKTIVHALIDPGSTHSYVCTSISSLGSLPKNEIEYYILVTTPLGHNVIINRVYRDCPIKIREYEFLGDLIELSLREFDVILGMN